MAEKTVQTDTNLPATCEQELSPTREPSRYVRPAVDIVETPQGLTVQADLPGVKLENVDIRVDGNILTIKGTPQATAQGKDVYREYSLIDYYRQFELSEAVDREKITAKLEQGVLTLDLPKAPAEQPRSIKVEMG